MGRPSDDLNRRMTAAGTLRRRALRALVSALAGGGLTAFGPLSTGAIAAETNTTTGEGTQTTTTGTTTEPTTTQEAPPPQPQPTTTTSTPAPTTTESSPAPSTTAPAGAVAADGQAPRGRAAARPEADGVQAAGLDDDRDAADHRRAGDAGRQ